jgi:hypothetical protein
MRTDAIRSRFSLPALCRAAHVVALAAALVLLPACGGGGGGGDGDTPPPPPATYSISGSITNAASGAGIAGVSVALSGTRTASTTTSASGGYSFASLPSGSYVLTPAMSGMAFQPASLPVTITSASVGGIDFVALSGGAIAAGIEFLPEWFSSADQLRASLVVRGSHVYFTDSSAAPLKRAALDGSGVGSLADRFRGARNVLVRGGYVYWVDASQLKRTPLAGGPTTVLAEGSADHGEWTTADLVVDDSFAYWANSVATPTCSPPCTWVIQRVPLVGGAPVTLVTVNRQVAALTADATRVFWEESSMEPLDPGCDCGSKVKSVPKAGGTITVLVDGSLNGTMPAPPPGQIPGTWLPTGGLTLTSTELVFARAGNSYDIMAIPLEGGTLRMLASVATPSYYASRALQGLTVAGSNVYFVDNFNHALSTVPLAGGAVTALASGLGSLSMTNSSVMAVSAGNAYWSELGTVSGCCIAGATGAIRRVALTGGAVSTIVGGADLPGSVTLDGTNLVWTEAWRVGKATSTGANPTTLASGIAANMARIAADATSIYVLDGSFIKKIPLGGGQAEKLANTSPLLDDLSLVVQDIATDGSSVYWTTAGGPSAPAVRKVSVSGGAVTIIGTGGGFVNPQDCYWRIAVQGGFVYWSSGGTSGGISCAVNRVPTGGGTVTTVVDYPYLADFTVDDSHVYFSDGSSNYAIHKIPLGGGAISLVSSSAAGWVMTNYGSRLYWVDLAVGTVAWSEKSATGELPNYIPGELWLEPLLAYEGINVDANGLYVTETQTGTIYGIR